MNDIIHLNHTFTFTGIVYIPLTLVLVYVAARYFRIWQATSNVLYRCLFHIFVCFVIICLSGALAGTVFSSSYSGIRYMLIISSFVLAYTNALIVFISIKESRIKISPWIGFAFVMIFGIVVTVLTMYAPILPFTELSGGVNWGMPEYIYYLRVAVYSLGIIPFIVVMVRKFQKTTDSRKKQHYLFLSVLFCFFYLIVITDFILEPTLGIPALSSEVTILIGALVGSLVWFTANEFLISRIERQFRHLIEKLKDLVFIIDNNGKIIYANPVFDDLLHWNPNALVNNDLTEIVCKDDHELIEINLKNASNGSVDKGFEFRFIKENGENLWVETTANFINIERFDNLHNVFLLVCHDISARKQTEKKLLETTIRAEESDRLKSAFLSNIYHEIRTPMNALFGLSEILSSDDLDDEEREKHLELLQANGNKLLKIIDDLIDLAKLEAENIKHEIKPCDYRNEILVALEDISDADKIRTGKIEIKTDFPKVTSGEYIMTVPTRLQQILKNLLSNAVKFTTEGSVKIGCFEEKGDQDRIVLYVEDTGIGIDPKYYADIFKPFRQLSEGYSKEFEGTGLGLSITQKLVELLNAKIWLESVPGKGSKFFVSFPVK